jgi:twitching motility protein PilI
MDRAADASPSSTETPTAVTAQVNRAWLAVDVAGVGMLFPLAQAGEIFPMQPILAMAHTQPWFLGVVNLRSALFGVVDLGAFLGLRSGAEDAGPMGRDQARLLALSPELRVHCALKVDHLAGLRRQKDLVPMAVADHRPAFAGPLWQDTQGRQWQEIDLVALARSESFLAIVSAASPVTEKVG